jgi:hypothetical protein
VVQQLAQLGFAPLKTSLQEVCLAVQPLPDAGMINSVRGRAYAISAIFTLSILAFIHEKGSLSGAYSTARIGGSSMPLDRWMQFCNFELYPNLLWKTVMSQHGSGQSVVTIFVPFAVDNNLAPWGSDIDDSDFHDCQTSCVWIRSRDTSIEGLKRSAHCAAQAHAILFWLPLGHPYKTGVDFGAAEGAEAIRTSGLIHGGNQVWLGVGTEPGLMDSFRSTPSIFSTFYVCVTPFCSSAQCNHKL